MLILDEADRMLDMGFLPAIRRIASILPKDRQTMCFSATMEGSMARLVKDYMKKPGAPHFWFHSQASRKTFACRRLKFAVDRKQELLQRLAGQGTRPLPGFPAHQTRHRTHRRKPEPRRLLRGHDSRRSLAIATHRRADRLPARTLSHPGGYRPGFTRNSRAGHRSRHQLRSARSGRKFHPSRRPHRPHGGHGLATTLFVKEQRSELFQLERTLGIKIERMRADDGTAAPIVSHTGSQGRASQDRLPVNLPRIASAPKQERFVLPGEVLQAQ